MPKDIQGRKYLTVDQAKSGLKIELDGDFTCVEKGAKRTLIASSDGLSFTCAEGLHNIEGQISHNGLYYVGLYPAAS